MKVFSPHEFIKEGHYHVPLLISNILFLSLFLVLALNQRLATDDFYFLANFLEHGVIQGTWTEYNTWSTRFSSVGLNQIVLFFQEKGTWALACFSLLSLAVFVTVVALNIKNIVRLLNVQSSHKLSGLYVLNLSIFLVSIMFITTVKIDETWFWLCASCTYLWGVMMLMLGVAWLTSAKNNALYTLFGVFGFVYLGGASGPLALIVLSFLLSIILFSNKYSQSLKLAQNKLRIKATVGFLVCLSAFLILYFGKGNQMREVFFEQLSVLDSMFLNVKMSGIIILKRLPSVLPLMLTIAFPMLYVASIHNVAKKISPWMDFLKLTILFAVVVYLYQLSITYKTQDVAAYRALFFVSVLTLMYIAKSYLIIGKNLPLTKLSAALFYSSFLFAPTLFAYQLVKQHSIAFEYSASYDTRMNLLENVKNKNEIILLSPLKNSGMLYSAEISTDTSFHSNQHLKQALMLKINVAKIETITEQ